MILMAVLVKELRLRMRRERTIWVLVLYVLVLGLLAWFTLNNSAYSIGSVNQWSSVGANLYHLLTVIQMLLILFITPAFTATAINSEKERQTYDMLLCSRLSSFSLVTGKLVAGLSNTFLLIVASLPLFSLVFFFGGIAPLTILQDLLTFVITAILVATLGVFCSTLFRRPAVSTALVYLLILLWLAIPVMVQVLAPSYTYNAVVSYGPLRVYTSNGVAISSSLPGHVVVGPTPPPAISTFPLWTAWNPFTALAGEPFASSPFLLVSGIMNSGQQSPSGYSLFGLILSAPVAYVLLSTLAILAFFGLSLLFVKPHVFSRLRDRIQARSVSIREQETPASLTT